MEIINQCKLQPKEKKRKKEKQGRLRIKNRKILPINTKIIF